MGADQSTFGLANTATQLFLDDVKEGISCLYRFEDDPVGTPIRNLYCQIVNKDSKRRFQDEQIGKNSNGQQYRPVQNKWQNNTLLVGLE